jgi:acetyl esterase/lipase
MDEISVESIWPRRGSSGRVQRRGFCVAGLASLLGGCSVVGTLNALAPQRLLRADIAYGSDARQRLDVYRPNGEGPYPVAIFIYGGNWDSGDRAMYRFVGGALAAAGFLTVIPDYRVFPQARYPDFLVDCAAAVAWTRREAPGLGGVAGAPWLIGHSAGAYNVAMLTLDPRWLGGVGLAPGADIRGTVGLAGPYDFLPLHDAELEAIFAPAVPLASSQPINHVSGDQASPSRAPPMLLLAGQADTTVEPANSTRLAARIRAAGGAVQERLYPGIDHKEIIGAFAGPLRFLAPSLRDSVAFMHGGQAAWQAA